MQVLLELIHITMVTKLASQQKYVRRRRNIHCRHATTN